MKQLGKKKHLSINKLVPLPFSLSCSLSGGLEESLNLHSLQIKVNVVDAGPGRQARHCGHLGHHLASRRSQ